MQDYKEKLEEDVFCFALAPKYLMSYCHGCLIDGSALRKCTGCRMFVYCSKECQKKDWRMHKNECGSSNGQHCAASEEVRLVMRLAQKWNAGDMGETQVDGIRRSLSTLQYHGDTFDSKACKFLEDFKLFFGRQDVSDDLIKSMKTAQMVPTLNSRIPTSLKDARHSYINELMPKSLRQEILKRDYNFYCECEGCLDDERNDRMEGWYCTECQDGWLPPRENAKCTSCKWNISTDHFELCRVAVETAKSGNDVLLSSSYKPESKVVLANKMMSVFEDTLYKFNVLRIPSLRVLYENAIAEKRTTDMLKFGSDLLYLQKEYQDEDDLALCHLKYGLAQAYKLAGKEEDSRQMLSGVREVFGRVYGPESRMHLVVSFMS